MAQFISGGVGTDGKPTLGAKFDSTAISQNPYAVVVTYQQPFDQAPVAFVSVSSSSKWADCSVQSSNTSLAIYTNSDVPLALQFLATDKGLG